MGTETAISVSALAITLADGPGHMGGWGWGMAIFGWLFMAALIALLAWLITSAFERQRSGSRDTSKAIDLLDARYARGEIEQDEYLQRRDDLER